MALYFSKRQHKEQTSTLARLLLDAQANEKKAYAKVKALEDQLVTLKNRLANFPKVNGDEITLH
jgi:hypothetical protein